MKMSKFYLIQSIVLLFSVSACTLEVQKDLTEPQPELQGQREASVLHFGQVLDNYVSLTGLTPNETIANEYLAARSNMVDSVPGNPEQMTAAAQLGLLKLVANMCQLLIDEEEVVGLEDRKVYGKIDFTQGPTPQFEDQTVIDSFLRRAALTAWGRNETASELADWREEMEVIKGDLNMGGGPGETKKLALAGCVSVFASYAAMDI